MSKKALFLSLSGFDPATPNKINIVNVDKFIGEYASLALGNGGSWCRRSAWKKHKVATMKCNGKINYLWHATKDDEKLVKKAFAKYPKCKGNKIQYIGIFGIAEQHNNRPIRKDIKQYYRKQSCCVCGSNVDIVVDHKNDLYNDSRVLNIDTQEFSDFQSLCNHCNLQKRQVCKKTRATGKRYGATNIPMLKPFAIDFTQGDETFDTKDINAMKGTFWYDPIAFMESIKTQ